MAHNKLIRRQDRLIYGTRDTLESFRTTNNSQLADGLDNVGDALLPLVTT